MLLNRMKLILNGLKTIGVITVETLCRLFICIIFLSCTFKWKPPTALKFWLDGTKLFEFLAKEVDKKNQVCVGEREERREREGDTQKQ